MQEEQFGAERLLERSMRRCDGNQVKKSMRINIEIWCGEEELQEETYWSGQRVGACLEEKNVPPTNFRKERNEREHEILFMCKRRLSAAVCIFLGKLTFNIMRMVNGLMEDSMKPEKSTVSRRWT